MTIWFNKKKGKNKVYCSKSISLNFYPQHYRLCYWGDNGAVKGNKEHSCYDLNIYFLGFFFSYTNWDYNSEIK